MSAFTVEMANRPGELARLCEILAARGVNLVVCGLAYGDRGTVAFIADDEDAARDALRASEIDYVEREALTLRLQNVPGAGAAAFRTLVEANINLEVSNCEVLTARSEHRTAHAWRARSVLALRVQRADIMTHEA